MVQVLFCRGAFNRLMAQGALIQCKYQFFPPNLSPLILPTGSREQFLDLPALPHPHIHPIAHLVSCTRPGQGDDPREDMFSSLFVAQQICSTLGCVIQVAVLDLMEHQIQEVPQVEHLFLTLH